MTDDATTYRLLTRSDMDGLVCAVLLKELGILGEIEFHHPKDVQDGKVAVTERDILTHAGKISHDTARLKAESEYDTFRVAQAALPQPVDQHFQDAIEELKKIEGEVKKETPKPPKRRKEKDE